LFKRVKYKQGYVDRSQGKPSRYLLEVDVARGDPVGSVSFVSDVPPPLAALRSTAATSRDPSAGASATAPLEEPGPGAVTSRDPPAGAAAMAPLAEPSSKAVEGSRLDIVSV